MLVALLSRIYNILTSIHKGNRNYIPSRLLKDFITGFITTKHQLRIPFQKPTPFELFSMENNAGCPNCPGAGYTHCPTCNGTGYAMANCHACGGHGGQYFNTEHGLHFEPCASCDGAGQGHFMCGPCKGTGSIESHCPNCGGTSYGYSAPRAPQGYVGGAHVIDYGDEEE